ncbi:hypothetical protein [Streptomyces chryseus]|uniref:Lipoprotein n=1 Tax=Streptomyces chryseus TaxID=68186 RepID=A0ABQ3EAP0_9ACTN|nr:hypothetical protein [Streptomyces chryseus]GHB32031.1 hypothetical protein GCM10010346_64200 [Streptomyces chryseus]
MGRQLWRSIAFIAVAEALTVSCAGWGAVIHAAEISTNQVAGRWASAGGTSLTFSDDHTFTAEHFDELPAASDCEAPSALSSGRWAFHAPDEADQFIVPAESATRGTALALIFSTGDCEVSAYLFGDEDDPVLCPTRDADEGCPSDGYLQRYQTTHSG